VLVLAPALVAGNVAPPWLLAERLEELSVPLNRARNGVPHQVDALVAYPSVNADAENARVPSDVWYTAANAFIAVNAANHVVSDALPVLLFAAAIPAPAGALHLADALDAFHSVHAKADAAEVVANVNTFVVTNVATPNADMYVAPNAAIANVDMPKVPKSVSTNAFLPPPW